MMKGDALMAASKKKPKRFIQSAIKRPGQLHRDLGVAEGKTIPPGRMAEAMSGSLGPAVKRRAQFAKTLGGFRK